MKRFSYENHNGVLNFLQIIPTTLKQQSLQGY